MISRRPPPRAPTRRALAGLSLVVLGLGLGLSSVATAQVGLGGSLRGRRGGLSLDRTEKAPTVRRVEMPRIKKIELGGLVRVDVAAVRKQIRLRAGEPWDERTVSEDVERIFRMRLFDDVRVGVKQVPPSKAGEPAQLIVRYQMLERPSVAKITVVGNDAVGREAIDEVLDLQANDLYSAADARRNANKIKDLYVDEGYFLATVTPRTRALPANQVELIFDVHERAEIKVRSVEILGNEGVSDEDIKAVLRTKEGSPLGFLGSDGTFKRDQLETDAQILQYLYLTRGYIQAKVSDPEVSLSADMRYVRITIRVSEGLQYKVGKVAISGDSVVENDKLLKRVQLKSGDTFNYQHVQADAQAIADAQKDFGYAFATVSNESVPHPETRTVDWTYHVQKGKKVFFGAVEMIGAATTRDKVIRRELAFTEGALYSEGKLKRSKMRVQRLGFFESVDIKTRPTANPQVVDVTVEVKERTTGTFQVGAGFSSVDNFITTAQISKDNFLGRGQRLSLQASLSAIRTMFQASFFEPYFFDTRVTFAIELYNFQTLFTDFTRTSTGGSLTWGYRFTDELLGDLTYGLERVRTEIGGISGRRNVSVSSLFNAGLTSSVALSLTYDSRDDRWLPTRGWFAQVSGEYALPAFGSQNEFYKHILRVRRYFPLPLDAVLKFNLVGGIVTAPQGTQVPLFERFFLGGIFNVRGYQLNTLGPDIPVPSSDDPGAPLSSFNIGGAKQLYLNNELEVPILKAPMNLRGVLFFDIGNAFGEDERVLLQQMRMSVGWGIRWFSPVGPLRFEWGVPINPDVGQDPLVFAFTIGNSF